MNLTQAEKGKILAMRAKYSSTRPKKYKPERIKLAYRKLSLLAGKKSFKVYHLIKDKEEVSVNRLADNLRWDQSALSRKLSDLKRVGFVKQERRGKYVFYSACEKEYERVLLICKALNDGA